MVFPVLLLMGEYVLLHYSILMEGVGLDGNKRNGKKKNHGGKQHSFQRIPGQGHHMAQDKRTSLRAHQRHWALGLTHQQPRNESSTMTPVALGSPRISPPYADLSPSEVEFLFFVVRMNQRIGQDVSLTFKSANRDIKAKEVFKRTTVCYQTRPSIHVNASSRTKMNAARASLILNPLSRKIRYVILCWVHPRTSCCS